MSIIPNTLTAAPIDDVAAGGDYAIVGDLSVGGTITGKAFNWNVGASPPSSPINGTPWIYNGIAGVYWMFVYDSSEATYKWKFVGGSPLRSGPSGAITRTNTSAVADMTGGPIVTIPRAGEYLVRYGVFSQLQTANLVDLKTRLNDISGSEIVLSSQTQWEAANISGEWFQSFSASQALILRVYNAQATGTGVYQLGWISIIPARII